MASRKEAVATVTDAERRVLTLYCLDHAVARCQQCHEDRTAAQLGANQIDGRQDFCPVCDVDLTEQLRWHIVTCNLIAAELTKNLDWSRLLRKASETERTRSEVLRAESEEIARRVLQRRT